MLGALVLVEKNGHLLFIHLKVPSRAFKGYNSWITQSCHYIKRKYMYIHCSMSLPVCMIISFITSQGYACSTLWSSAWGGGGDSTRTWWNLALTESDPGVTIDVRPGTRVPSWSLWNTHVPVISSSFLLPRSRLVTIRNRPFLKPIMGGSEVIQWQVRF